MQVAGGRWQVAGGRSDKARYLRYFRIFVGIDRFKTRQMRYLLKIRRKEAKIRD
ncbi:hypothetical protein [Alicyclobacillus acidoterrestris]|uniref:Uncharacterized protein n=1 Tax=Alicyclobacillus acidoterrestris (strain ATCC 49025 / DSM 3922 / CIP 106132 / NCIMB 13137 / GD3B) TaxID=1356854 RepID=T0C913_ALIAG|nr:hypothetical protein [Alicyclobacillus acidoterrestris]EPZ52668.1 hypothetical protein N007_19990 [Alicyclobacillus acidoterrestris ATCC 49025]UNO48622.1 hypothetical protein K1I37_18485 [Alicyclobacillus acidoterrestris]